MGIEEKIRLELLPRIMNQVPIIGRDFDFAIEDYDESDESFVIKYKSHSPSGDAFVSYLKTVKMGDYTDGDAPRVKTAPAVKTLWKSFI